MGGGGVLSIISCPLFIASANSPRSEKVNIFDFSPEGNPIKSSAGQFNRLSTIPFVFLSSYLFVGLDQIREKTDGWISTANSVALFFCIISMFIVGIRAIKIRND